MSKTNSNNNNNNILKNAFDELDNMVKTILASAKKRRGRTSKKDDSNIVKEFREGKSSVEILIYLTLIIISNKDSSKLYEAKGKRKLDDDEWGKLSVETLSQIDVKKFFLKIYILLLLLNN